MSEPASPSEVRPLITKAPNRAGFLAIFPAWLPLGVLAALMMGLTAEAARKFLRVTGPNDVPAAGDFVHYHEAAKAVLEGRDIYLAHIQWYSYPPMLAALLAPMGKLSLQTAGAVWAVFNGIAITGVMILSARELLRRFEVERTLRNVGIVALFGALIMVDKVRSEMRLGQCDAIVMLALFGALACLGRRPLLGGLLLGVATNIKYQGLIMLPYLLVRRRWVEAASSVIWAVVIGLSSAAVFGWERNIHYLARAFNGLGFVLGLIPKDQEGPNLYPLEWEKSLGVPSVLARLSSRIGSGNSLVIGGTALVAGACFLLAWRLFTVHGLAMWKGRGGKADDATARNRSLVALEWSGLIAAVLAFSPQTTSRHMILLLLVTSMAALTWWFRSPRIPAGWLVAGVVICVLGLVLPPGGKRFAEAQLAWRSVGGAMWCFLIMYFATLHTGLAWIAERDRPEESGITNRNT